MCSGNHIFWLYGDIKIDFKKGLKAGQCVLLKFYRIIKKLNKIHSIPIRISKELEQVKPDNIKRNYCM